MHRVVVMNGRAESESDLVTLFGQAERHTSGVVTHAPALGRVFAGNNMPALTDLPFMRTGDILGS